MILYPIAGGLFLLLLDVLVHYFVEGRASLLEAIFPSLPHFLLRIGVLALVITVGVLMSRNYKKLGQAIEEIGCSEEKYRTIIDDMDQAYFELDLKGYLTYVNNAQCRNLGYSREELIGMHYKRTIVEEDEQAVRKAFKHMMQAGGSRTGILRKMVRKDGSILFAEIGIFPLVDRQGNIVGLRGIGRDITRQKQAEEALKVSEKRYRTILEEMGDGYFEGDLTGTATFVNDAACRMLGRPKEELIGINYRELVDSEDKSNWFQTMNHVYRTGEPAYNLIWETKDNEGETHYIRTTTFPKQDEKGKIDGFRAVGLDITERKRSEDALRESEERYRVLAENIVDVISLGDLDGRILYCSPSIKYLVGYEPEEVVGKKARHFLTSSSREANDKALGAYLREARYGQGKKRRASRNIELEWECKDGSTVWTENTLSLLCRSDGQPHRIVSVAHDITERRQMEREKDELERKAHLSSRLATVGEMAAGIAHEINNPLVSVVGYAQLMMQKDIPEELRDYAQAIYNGGKRVADIVRKLLVFARQTKPQRSYVDINELIKNTLELREYAFKSGNIKLDTALAPDLPRTIADGGQLQQVFLNIIMNAESAMKAAHNGGKLTIRTKYQDNTITISLKDTGQGISKENLERIFDPFFTTREVGQGSGLGLSMAHGIVQEHGGRIYAKSGSNKGAIFYVELPVVIEPAQLELVETASERPKPVGKARILVVDDEPAVLKLLAHTLRGEGHDVDTIDNAADALEMIKQNKYRLLVLDIKMPGMSGIELYKRLQKVTGTPSQSVLFVTGDVMSTDTAKFLSRTRASHINKPFDISNLRKEINRLLAETQ